MVGLDAKDGKVAVDGWSKMTGHDLIDLAKKFEDYGAEAVIYTDIGRDGMLSGVNIDATVKLARQLTMPVIASGGVTNLDDVKALCAVLASGLYCGIVLGFGVRSFAFVHAIGFISSVLFLVPGFPLVAGLLDLTQHQATAGITRLFYGVLLFFASLATGLLLVGLRGDTSSAAA